jgi:putative ribosome biogenesis GTPase RsgA
MKAIDSWGYTVTVVSRAEKNALNKLRSYIHGHVTVT